MYKAWENLLFQWMQGHLIKQSRQTQNEKDNWKGLFYNKHYSLFSLFLKEKSKKNNMFTKVNAEVRKEK